MKETLLTRAQTDDSGMEPKDKISLNLAISGRYVSPDPFLAPEVTGQYPHFGPEIVCRIVCRNSLTLEFPRNLPWSAEYRFTNYTWIGVWQACTNSVRSNHKHMARFINPMSSSICIVCMVWERKGINLTEYTRKSCVLSS